MKVTFYSSPEENFDIQWYKEEVTEVFTRRIEDLSIYNSPTLDGLKNALEEASENWDKSDNLYKNDVLRVDIEISISEEDPIFISGKYEEVSPYSEVPENTPMVCCDSPDVVMYEGFPSVQIICRSCDTRGPRKQDTLSAYEAWCKLVEPV